MTTVAAYLTRYIAHQLAQKPPQRPPIRLGNKKIDPKLAEYEDALDELLEDALSGEIGKDEFKREWEAAALAILLLAFGLGSGGTVTTAGQKRLDELEKIARDSTAGLADDIYSGKYEDNPEGLKTRGELWVQSAAGAYSEGQVYDSTAETNLRWVRNPEKDSCVDCIRLDGQVHTRDEWARAGIFPGSDELACTGRRCGCRWEETDEPSQGMEF